MKRRFAVVLVAMLAALAVAPAGSSASSCRLFYEPDPGGHPGGGPQPIDPVWYVKNCIVP
jgi:hypothetical protein